MHLVKLLLLGIILSGCESNVQAPVEELKPQYTLNHANNTYIVKEGDTLYAIAFLFDKNVEQIASINNINYPYSLRAGQLLTIGGKAQAQKYHHEAPVRGAWTWPTIAHQIEYIGKGANIFGSYGQAVYAARAGTVAYAGHGLPGYGKLILIKHDKNYLTAYAFNANILVHEGQEVLSGQKIATMGYLSSHKPGLHFEIRYRGQAINPKRFLNG